MDSPKSTAQTDYTSTPMMNEDEVKQIITNYQITIRKISDEINTLVPQHAQLKERSGNLMAQIMQYSQDLEKFKVFEQFLKEELPILKESVQEEIDFLESEYSTLINKDSLLNIDLQNPKQENEEKQEQQQVQEKQNNNIQDKEEEEKNDGQDLLDEQIDDNQQKEQNQNINNNDDQIQQSENQELQQQQHQKSQSLVLEKMDKYNNEKNKRQSVQSLRNVNKRQSFIQKRDSLLIQLYKNKEINEENLQIPDAQSLYQEFFGDDEQNLKFIKNLNSDIQRVKGENEQLENDKNQKIEQSLKLAYQLREDDISKMQIKYCINCKKNFSPFTNNDEACTYHLGQLKFYSCQQCGRDEYYNCCNACMLCSKGCHTKNHVSTL